MKIPPSPSATLTNRWQVSVLSLADLLRSIISHPESFLGIPQIEHALSTQTRMAKFESEGIAGMSLNQQKRIADEVLGKYAVLDGLRLEALSAIRRAHSGSDARPGTRRSKEATVRTLLTERALLLQDLALLQRAYDLRCAQAKRYAAAAAGCVPSLCAKEQKEIDIGLSLRRLGGKPSCVFVSLEGGLLREREDRAK